MGRGFSLMPFLSICDGRFQYLFALGRIFSLHYKLWGVLHCMESAWSMGLSGDFLVLRRYGYGGRTYETILRKDFMSQ